MKVLGIPYLFYITLPELCDIKYLLFFDPIIISTENIRHLTHNDI